MSEPAADGSNISLTPVALKPKAGSPWDDDALQRQGIASELNSLVADLANGEDSATIALDGGYGTGKTFVLERWVQAMQDQRRVAVYYNAWENDSDDDPLVSLIEALASDARTKKWRQAAWKTLNEAVDGIVRKFTGVDAGNVRKALTGGQAGGLLDAAAARRTSRQKLKELLTKLVEATRKEEEFGVVVVIDELDRCRPTFAIELLERVKHVLNVPGLVFVFGVNMIALRETVKAVYGDIEAHQYLLRMFTTTWHMPPTVALHGREEEDRARNYVKYLVDRHGLRAFCRRNSLLAAELSRAESLLSILAASSRVTPREMERMVWLLAKVASTSLQPDRSAYSMIPLVLVPLAVARVKAPEAYYQAVSIPDRAPAALDCLFDLIRDDHLYKRKELDRMELMMYRVCHEHPPTDPASQPPAYVCLHEYAKEDGSSVLDDRHLSRRLAQIDKERAQWLLTVAPSEHLFEQTGNTHLRLDLNFAALRFITSRFDAVWPRTPAS